MDIREELDHDRQGIFDVVIATYGGTDEAQRIEDLDNHGLVITSLVAVEYGEIVAHILFSELELALNDHEGPIPAALLYPVTVAPTHQRMGIGSELVRQGIEKCEGKGIEAVISLGQSAFFERLGFSVRDAENLKSPFSPGFVSILTLNFTNNADLSGEVIFPPSFR